MSTPFVILDLNKQAPSSPRKRLAGFAIARRTLDKCLASLVGKLGQYHYDCPLDNSLFSFKGITAEQFKGAARALKDYEQMGIWLHANGTVKTADEIKTWSDEMEAGSLINNPDKRDYFIENCHKLGLNPQMNTTFDWLEADDRESFRR
jgi:uncharacterized protein DUF5069